MQLTCTNIVFGRLNNFDFRFYKNQHSMRNFKLFLTILFLLPFFSFSQILEPIKWSFKVEQTKPDEATLVMKAKIDNKWHLYSQYNPPPPDGPISTSFKFTKSKSFELVGKVIEEKPIEEKDVQFDNAILKFYVQKADFRQKIKILDAKDFEVKGVLEFMCCDDHQCLPPTEVEYVFNIKGNPAATTANAPPAVTPDTNNKQALP